jgi:hypothetical protein
LGNLVLACGSCNGDEKREASWHEFLKQKTTDLALRSARQARIEAWFDSHASRTRAAVPEVEELSADLERLVEQFGVKCAELRQLDKDANRS